MPRAVHATSLRSTSMELHGCLAEMHRVRWVSLASTSYLRIRPDVCSQVHSAQKKEPNLSMPRAEEATHYWLTAKETSGQLVQITMDRRVLVHYNLPQRLRL